MEDQLQSASASPSSFGTSLTARYVASSRRDHKRELKQAIVLLLVVQVLYWGYVWITRSSLRDRTLDMFACSWPAALFLVALHARAPRATMIVVAVIAWALCALIVGLAT